MGPERTYLERLAQGRFEIQRCAACGKHVFYPRVLCPHCGAERLEWIVPAGSGTVYSTTVVRSGAAGGSDRNIVLIDLDEGVRVMSRVAGIAPDAVRIGMRVQARVAAGVLEFVAL